MSDQPGEDTGASAVAERPPDPLDRELDDIPTWITISAIFLGLLTIILVGTAVSISTTGRSDSATSQKSPAPEPSEPSPTATKAEPLANIKCDDTFIVEIARSDPPFENSAVEDALSKNRDAKYLEADQSCATYAAAGDRLIAYIGPFDDLSDACAARLDLADVKAVPHVMNADQKGPNYCFCAAANPPVLENGDGENGNIRTLLLISEVQRIMKRLGLFEPAVDGDPYGPQTSTAVQQFQFSANIPVTGTVNKATWTALKQGKDPDGLDFC